MLWLVCQKTDRNQTLNVIYVWISEYCSAKSDRQIGLVNVMDLLNRDRNQTLKTLVREASKTMSICMYIHTFSNA